MKSLNETTQLVRDEHKKLRGLARQLEGLSSRELDFYRAVVGELCTEIQIYLELEERWFPRLDAELSMKWFDVSGEVRARIGATDAGSPSHAKNPRGGEQQRKIS